jgi:flavodoxin I
MVEVGRYIARVRRSEGIAMNALVIYDSQFGNTEQIARAIASHLEAQGIVRFLAVSDAAGLNLIGVDLLVIGGPTQGHSARQPLRDWVEQLSPSTLQSVVVATFDTRLRWPVFLAGSAARSIAKTLKNNGARLLVPPESFFVEGREGPLAKGEIERAEAWADTLAVKRATKTASLNPIHSTSH